MLVLPDSVKREISQGPRNRLLPALPPTSAAIGDRARDARVCQERLCNRRDLILARFAPMWPIRSRHPLDGIALELGWDCDGPSTDGSFLLASRQNQASITGGGLADARSSPARAPRATSSAHVVAPTARSSWPTFLDLLGGRGQVLFSQSLHDR